VKELWRFPIKSMQGERLESADFDIEGLRGDRAFALLDIETDKIVTAKSLKRFPDIFSYSAQFSEEPVPGSPLPAVHVELPGGGRVSTLAENFDEVLSGSLGQAVRLIRVGERDDIPYHDACPVSVLTESTLARLRELQPGSDFDVRRFRMNVIVESSEPGFPENDWVGLAMNVGAAVRLQLIRPNARCVMTTLAQDELPLDKEIFAAMVRHNRLEMENTRRYPCAGVYARVTTGGRVARGDSLSA